MQKHQGYQQSVLSTKALAVILEIINIFDIIWI